MAEDLLDARRERAYEVFDAGDLDAAAAAFADLVRQDPQDASLHYMAGLAAKYRGDWSRSLAANLASIELDADNEGARWNAAIAATALGDWAGARAQWRTLGIDVPGEAGPIEGNYGVAKVRLNPWGPSESVYGRRIDPVRMRIENVPLPESGHRFGDLVLNDGASLGKYTHGERSYHVFNALQRLQASPFATYTVFVRARREADLQPLLEVENESIGHIEDWTRTVNVLCLRCSYGMPHEHAQERRRDTAPGWTSERTLGIAATDRQAVESLLEGWISRWKGRHVDGIESRDFPLPERVPAGTWWRSPDDE